MGFDPHSEDAKALLQEMQDDGVGLCFIALGAPKQEMLAAQGRDTVPSMGLVSIGAGLDFFAGKQKRAPVWVRRIAMEWLWRMLGNPRRLVGRYMQCFAILPGQMIRALKLRLRRA
jgi:exopolysaccharide biosynthesis WecB/TagA/CpsF family protein